MKNGFSLMEIIVSVGILMILIVGVYSLIVFSINMGAENSKYVEAMAIANEKMEKIRNMAYVDVGTQAGSPSGPIPDNETMYREGTFNVNTVVIFYDDPYDGTIASGTDVVFTDYKIATVKVTWQTKLGNRQLAVFSKIIPRTEETNEGYGLLKLIVVDANGNPVPGADIHIENNAFIPALSADFVSDLNGELSYAVLPEFESYEITVTKPGYGTDKTYDRDAVNPNPSKPHLTVVNGVKTEESFSIDLLSLLRLYTVSQDLPDNWRVSSDASGKDQTNARMAFDSNGFLYLVWQDYRQSADAKIYAQKYDDDGNDQWPLDVVIGTANNQILPDIMVDDSGDLYAAWNDDSVGNQDSYLTKLASADGTDLWGGRKINTLVDSADQTGPRISNYNISSIIASVVWQDDRNSDMDVFYQRFDTAGNQLLTPEIKINTNAAGDGTDQKEPVIANDSFGNSIIAWTDGRNGNLDVYSTLFSSTTARSWESKINSDTGTTDQYNPDIDVDTNDYFYVVWTDERNGDPDIYAQKFDSAGTAQWASDVRINTDTDYANQYTPSIAIDSSDNLYIVWTDERYGDPDIFAQKYDSAGNSLWLYDIRVNVNTGNSVQYNPDVVINPIDDHAYASWQDDRNGDNDIFVTEINTYGATSSVANIPLSIVGTKRIGENPIIYEYDKEYFTGANGILNLVVEWDVPGYTINVISASTTYTHLMSLPTSPVYVLPDDSRNVTIIVE